MFIDDEADVSDDDSEDDDDSFLISQTHFTQTVDEGDPSVDMRAKYLQSIRFEYLFSIQQKNESHKSLFKVDLNHLLVYLNINKQEPCESTKFPYSENRLP